jgi:hypothetical protein
MRLIDADALDKRIYEEIPIKEFGTVKRMARMREIVGEAPTVGGWISVKDRLPEAAGYECLVCAVNENYNQTHVFTAHTGYGEPGWWTSNVHYMSRAKSPTDNSLHPALKVTHWMPLPEPPKEETL